MTTIPDQCPVCGESVDDDCQIGPADIDGDMRVVSMACPVCESEWDERYQFQGLKITRNTKEEK